MSIEPMDTQTLSQKPLVSFIIPAYNLPAEWLTACLESIMGLSLSACDREIILIDDGSTTPLIDCLTAYKDEILYIRQPNKGAAAARNLGISICSGKYIQFIDGDDFIIKVAYEHCLDIARYYNPDIVVFDYTENNTQEVNFDVQGPLSGASYMHQHNLKVAPWRYLFAKDILLHLRFTPGRFNEDEEFTPLLLLRAERLFYTSAKAYHYRQHPDSLANNTDKAYREKRLHDTEAILLRLQETAFALPDFDRKALNRRIAQLTMDYIYNTIRYTHDAKLLNQTLQRLEQHALFPLPEKNYTRKYMLFRKLANSRLGRRLLLALIR